MLLELLQLQALTRVSPLFSSVAVGSITGVGAGGDSRIAMFDASSSVSLASVNCGNGLYQSNFSNITL